MAVKIKAKMLTEIPQTSYQVIVRCKFHLDIYQEIVVFREIGNASHQNINYFIVLM